MSNKVVFSQRTFRLPVNQQHYSNGRRRRRCSKDYVINLYPLNYSSFNIMDVRTRASLSIFRKSQVSMLDTILCTLSIQGEHLIAKSWTIN